jgi:hypothetical protein
MTTDPYLIASAEFCGKDNVLFNNSICCLADYNFAGWASSPFKTCFFVRLAIAFCAAVVHFFAVLGSEKVTFPLLRVLPFDVSKCFATSGSR